jgi:hypothetical protein
MYFEDKTFATVDNFTDLLIDHCNEDKHFVVVCKYDTACAIFKDIMTWEDADVELADIELGRSDISGYGYEYLISFVGNELFVEKLRFKGGVLPRLISECDDISYIEADCDGGLIELMSNNLTIFSIDELDENEE